MHVGHGDIMRVDDFLGIGGDVRQNKVDAHGVVSRVRWSRDSFFVGGLVLVPGGGSDFEAAIAVYIEGNSREVELLCGGGVNFLLCWSLEGITMCARDRQQATDEVEGLRAGFGQNDWGATGNAGANVTEIVFKVSI